jgi:hypothetical protein
LRTGETVPNFPEGARLKTLQENISGLPSAHGFDPKLLPGEEPKWLGTRRAVVSRSESIRWRWPSERTAQYQAFDDWFDIAAQIIHRDGAGFRLLAVYKLVINWKRGNLWQSDAELAKRAGRCSVKAISRDVALHKRLGIIEVDHGCRDANGQKLKTRTISLSVPSPFPTWVDVGSLTTNMDTRGPDGSGGNLDTRGPDHMDTRGLITIGTIEEGASRDVSA